MFRKKVILVVGPTAVGKTDICVKLAQWLRTDVVSADSRQFYQEMLIGTAKPLLAEQQGVKHWFIDSHQISSYYSAGDFEREAIQLLDSLLQQKQTAIVTGGSGLFVKALTHGLDDMPEAPLALREQLMQRLHEEGVEALASELTNLDPTYAATADLSNSQRVVRALEVCLATGRPFSSYRNQEAAERPFDWIKIGLERPREELYVRINARVDAMIAAGLVEEVAHLAAYRQHNALQTVGYKEIFDYLDGSIPLSQAIDLVKRNTRRYAKRQLTWFKNQDEFTWFHPDNYEQIKGYIHEKLGDVNGFY